MLRIIFLLTFLFSTAFAGAPIIFSGSDAKTLKQNIDLYGVVKVDSGTLDPSSSAVDAPKGSLYISTNGNLYQKQDAGSTTNWTPFSSGGGVTAIVNGGTGQTTANDAFNALAPSQTGNSGFLLTTDGTNTSWLSVAVVSTPATGNTFIGDSAGLGNTANFNTAIGWHALTSAPTGGTSTAVGAQALDSMVGGTNNTSLGTNSCTSITSASDSSCFGYGSDVQNHSRAFAMGDGSIAAADNVFMLGVSTTNVGIGNVNSSIATARLHIPPGTSTAGTAPLKIEPGTLLGTPEQGAIEFDGTSLYYTDNTSTRQTISTGGGGGGANTALSNLASTAINTSLIYNGVGLLKTNDTTSSNSSLMEIASGDTVTSGNSGAIAMHSGQPDTNGNSGEMDLYTSDASGSGTAGDIQITTGAGNTTGGVLIQTGPATANAGDIILEAGSGSPAGKVEISGAKIQMDSPIAVVGGDRVGTSTLSSGTVTVSNTGVTSSTKVFLTAVKNGAACVGSVYLDSLSAGVNFIVKSTSPTDSCDVNWFLIEAF